MMNSLMKITIGISDYLEQANMIPRLDMHQKKKPQTPKEQNTCNHLSSIISTLTMQDIIDSIVHMLILKI